MWHWQRSLLRAAKRLWTVGDGDGSAGCKRTIASQDRRDCVADDTCDEVKSSLRLVDKLSLVMAVTEVQTHRS